ncbi:MAG TPA: RodZ domain-containing protein [Methylophilaceae bacterium]|nr:RodZ domain-containing protein [Methylophilaceae bacterium]
MSESLDTENLDTNAEATPRLGEVLREKREELSLSIEDVSNRLRLSPRQIKALENNDFAAFSEAMMTRGFIRNYARLLEIDADPLLAAYRTYVPNDAPHALSIQSANVLLPTHQRRSSKKYLLVIVLAALLAGGWVLYSEFFPHDESSKQPVVTATENHETEANAEAKLPVSSEPMPEAALPLAERLEQAPEEPAAIAPAAPTPNSTVAAEPVKQSPVPVSKSPGASIKPEVKAGLGPALKIKFSFSEQSWISVIDRNGNEIFNKTKAAGTVDEIEGQPPLKIVVGNAAGTQVIYKGKPIDLAPYSKLNVARLNLSLE